MGQFGPCRLAPWACVPHAHHVPHCAPRTGRSISHCAEEKSSCPSRCDHTAFSRGRQHGFDSSHYHQAVPYGDDARSIPLTASRRAACQPLTAAGPDMAPLRRGRTGSTASRLSSTVRRPSVLRGSTCRVDARSPNATARTIHQQLSFGHRRRDVTSKIPPVPITRRKGRPRTDPRQLKLSSRSPLHPHRRNESGTMPPMVAFDRRMRPVGARAAGARALT